MAVISLLAAPPKPAKGAACNGCGYCCVQQPCKLAVELLGATSGPCIALEYADDRTYCGLVKRPAYYLFGETVTEVSTGALSVSLAAMLGLGAGCDADDED